MNPERFKCLLLQINADQMLVEELGPIMERWVARDPDAKAQAGEFDDDLAAASILQEYEARIGALERLVGDNTVGFLTGPRTSILPTNDGDGALCAALSRITPTKGPSENQHEEHQQSALLA